MYSNMVAQLKSLGAEDLLDDAMKLIPKVRRDAGLVPLVTPPSQIVGAQAVSLAIDRKKEILTIQTRLPNLLLLSRVNMARLLYQSTRLSAK